MASIVVNRGLLRIGAQAFQSTPTYSVSRHVQTMSVDDSVTALAAGTTNLGSPTNLYDAAFGATPTESGQTIICSMTIPTGSGNFTIRRLCEHDDTAANVTGASTTLVAGVDAQALTKTSDFSLAITKQFTFTSV